MIELPPVKGIFIRLDLIMHCDSYHKRLLHCQISANYAQQSVTLKPFITLLAPDALQAGDWYIVFYKYQKSKSKISDQSDQK